MVEFDAYIMKAVILGGRQRDEHEEEFLNPFRSDISFYRSEILEFPLCLFLHSVLFSFSLEDIAV